MGLGTGTPCCGCTAGALCDPNGEATWDDDFQDYQQGQALTEFGYLPVSILGDTIESIAVSDGSGGLMISGAVGLDPSQRWAGRHGPFDIERFTSFAFDADFIQVDDSINDYGISIGLKGSSEDVLANATTFTFTAGGGSSVNLTAFGDTTNFPIIGADPTQMSIIVTVTDVDTQNGTGGPEHRIQGTLRGYDRGGTFDETVAFDSISYVTSLRLCRAQYAVFGDPETSGGQTVFGTDNWNYSAT